MPHSRKRYLEAQLKKALKASPIVGVMGQRQVGKTTLIESFAKTYVTLDLNKANLEANHSPEQFLLQRETPLAIDECQLAPPLFPALKERVRTHKTPGQFLLSGSIRFTSRKAIRESLTGRILNLELLPFTLSEMHELPMHDPENTELLKSKSRFKVKDFEEFLRKGGLPGIAFRRNELIRTKAWQDHLATILDRDLRLIIDTSLRFASLRSVLESLAQQVGGPLDISDLSRKTRISRITLRKLIHALEGLFLIRIIPCEGQATPRVFFEDVGLLQYLQGTRVSDEAILLQGFYQCIRAWYYYHDLPFEFFQYQTRGGSLVPLVIRSKRGITGYIFSFDGEVTPAMTHSAQSFCKEYPGAKVMILGESLKYEEVTKNVFIGSWMNLL